MQHFASGYTSYVRTTQVAYNYYPTYLLDLLTLRQLLPLKQPWGHQETRTPIRYLSIDLLLFHYIIMYNFHLELI